MPASRALRLSKMHGAGNDFVVLDLRDGQAAPTPAVSRALADRHTGVGCDQILTIEPPRNDDAVASYRIWNADGSSAQQCGNGARCVAAWLVRDGSAQGTSFLLDSPAGTHVVERIGDNDYRIAMGVPQFAPQAIGMLGFDRVRDSYDLHMAEDRIGVGAVSLGNPHALLEVDAIGAAPVATLGAALQTHAAFPDAVNVGFAQVLARDRIALRVYERGVGETLACGSGACAAVAVLVKRDRVDRDVRVGLPGGELQVSWPDDTAPMTLSGPAAFVFDGDYFA